MEKPMKSSLPVVAVALFAFAGLVHGHAKLEKSVPAANSTLAAPPKTVELEFSEAVQITALTVQGGSVKAQEIGPLPKSKSTRIALPMPHLPAGSYTVAWRALSADSHVMSGKIQFTIGVNSDHASKGH
jgi:copper transport protein